MDDLYKVCSNYHILETAKGKPILTNHEAGALTFSESTVRQFNRPLGLRAPDAAHLYVFSKASGVDPAMQLVTFDQEMQSAALTCSLPVWT